MNLLPGFRNRKHFPPGSRKIEDYFPTYSNDSIQEEQNTFLDLIKKMLLYDQDKRIKPLEALKHPFIASNFVYSYAEESTEEVKKMEQGNFAAPYTVSETVLNINFDNLNLDVSETHENETNSDSKHKTQSCNSI
ncbi:hypothetical protein HZS_3069 [Henneguya salminicola]|nr:hypothetical protein HZS_3069 [Henneguya salminicola]